MLKLALEKVRRVRSGFFTWERIRARRRQLINGMHRGIAPLIYLETTSACNLNCVMCPCQRPSVKRFKPDLYMDFDLFCNLVDQIAKQKPIPELRLHKDGEPLLHPRIVEMIDYAAARIPHVTLATNATLLDETMAASILETRLHEIRFSLEGSNRETYAKIRRQSPTNPHRDTNVDVGYDAVVTNIIRFSNMRREKASDAPRIGIRITEFEPTRGEICTVVEFWKKWADYVHVAPLLSWSGAVSVRKSAPAVRYPCMQLWNMQVISSDGTMVPCSVYVDETGSGSGRLCDLHNISIKNAFCSREMNELRKAHLEGNIDSFEFCANCVDWDTGDPTMEKLWSQRFKRAMLREIDRLDRVQE